MENDITFQKIGTVLVGPEIGNYVGIYSAAVDPATNTIYINNLHTPNIVVLDGNTRQFTKTIALAETEHFTFCEMVFNPITNKVYASASYDDTIYVIDNEKQEVIHKFKTGEKPANLAVDEKTGIVYIANNGEHSVSVVDSKTDTIINTIPVQSRPYSVAVDSDAQRVYVVCQLKDISRTSHFVDPDQFPQSIVCVIDIPTGKVIKEITAGRRSRYLAVKNKKNKLYVSSRADDSVMIFDTRSYQLISIVRLMNNQMGIVINDKNDKVYIVNLLGKYCDTFGQPSTVSVIDGESNKLLKNIDVGVLAWDLTIK